MRTTMTPPAPTPPPALRTLWHPRAAQLARLLAGLWLFGTGDALIVHAALGNAPWTVLAQGVALHLPLSIGTATQLIGVLVLAGWIPLRERPGLGTVLNVVVIGAAIDVVLPLLPDLDALVARWAVLLTGIVLIGLGSGAYLSARLGPGPRDGLMTGIARRTRWRLSRVRAGIELSVLALGAALGGTVGVGTVAFALLIGPAVALGVRALDATLRPTAGMPRA